MKFLFNQNYIFESASSQLTYYIHVMNAELSFVHAINQTNYFITILCRTQISHLTELNLIRAYLINTEIIILVL